MSKGFGFELLEEQLIDYIRGELEWMATEAVGDSEIERLLYLAMVTGVMLGLSEYHHVIFAENEDKYQSLLEEASSRRCLIVRSQVQLPDWRVDFIVSAFNWRFEPYNWRCVIVECDGHNFHERTKEQAARDRGRDRKATLDGLELLRFTGSEIWRDPLGCARQIFDWASKGVP